MFGVDQCRVCGKPIVVRSPEAVTEQEKAIRNPVVPEKVWRAAGLLTPPTPMQWRKNPADGCCGPCGRRLLREKYKTGLRFWLLLGGMIAVAAVVIAVVKFLPH
ncbi:MAG: hypothetical protein WDN04_20650 [Rhodospirillales bacterium]